MAFSWRRKYYLTVRRGEEKHNMFTLKKARLETVGHIYSDYVTLKSKFRFSNQGLKYISIKYAVYV